MPTATLPTKTSLLAACVASLLAIAPLRAQQAELNTPRDLQQRLDALERELRELRSHVAGPQSPTPAAGTAPRVDEHHYPEVRVTGFFQLDAGWYSQDARSKAALGDIDDALGFRRARLAAAGKVAENVSFLMEFDAAQAQARFVDVWAQLDRSPIGRIRVGRFRQPFGMDELTSIRELPFLERSLAFALAPFRQTGVQLADTAMGERATWAIAGYRYLSDNFGNVYADTTGYGMAARITGLLVEDGDTVLHLGADYSHNQPALGTVRYATQNEFFGGENPLGGANALVPSNLTSVPLFVDTGVLPATRTDLWNVEAAFGSGNVTVQAEARWARVDTGAGAATFPGGYAQARWVLTGECIPYVKTGGVFGRVKPQSAFGDNGWGAVELAARASYLDLNSTGVNGRSIAATTIGLSWYLDDRTRLQCNWIHDQLDTHRPGGGIGSTDTFALSAQIDF